ncbi:MAG TPA: Stp1/IreP family PP2C-type Ser/Thr phosphatase [Solirubrobacteraceae bacterium]|nr:Stp1/IreP family PP2C-type Ser/Thr phosphatase [Solirubrobacteraceae bacterium]
MLRVADQYAGTDTGRQRRANEDSLLARSPLFVVADGMGGAQAGEVASRIAVEYFRDGLEDASRPEAALTTLALAANSRIHELSHSSAEHAGMGTTLTAVYVGEQEIAIAHVGDSRAYCLRDGELMRLTDDHSLVDELMRQGRLTPEEAVEHPQRSVITRALGPEGMVEVDTRSFRARPGDVYLLCSDGLTTMLSEEEIADLLRAHARLRDAGEALIAAANEAGGRDNITVVLLRLEDAEGSSRADGGGDADDHATMLGVPAVTAPVTPRRPRSPAAAAARDGAPSARRRRRLRRAGSLAVVLVVLGLIGAGCYVALQSVYFIGTNDRGLVTLYRGVPFRLPGDLALYSSRYVSGVSASTLSAQRRETLLDHSLRSQSSAADLLRSLELGQLE